MYMIVYNIMFGLFLFPFMVNKDSKFLQKTQQHHGDILTQLRIRWI